MANQTQASSHSIRLDGREKLTVSGVTEIASFEDTAALLDTAMGQLVVEGENLQLKSMAAETGVVTIEGTVDALGYRKAPVGGWLKRLLG